MKHHPCIKTLILLPLLCVWLGCDSKPTANQSGTVTNVSKTASEEPKEGVGSGLSKAQLLKDAEYVVGKIGELETRKDVTCWTSFRQLDSFIATKQYSDHATLTKIKVVKQVALATWLEASKRGGLSKLPVWVAPEDDTLEKAKKDYQTTSEHWRLILSVLMELVDQPSVHAKLMPLDPEALEVLAQRMTSFSLHLLRLSGSEATLARSPQIEASNVLGAYETLQKQNPWLGGVLASMNKTKVDKPGQNQTDLKTRQALTKKLISAKVKALLSYNKERDLGKALEKVSRKPLTKEAKRWMLLRLKSFVRFVASGYEPMRADNHLSDGSFEPSALPRNMYPDAVWVENVVMQIFPHVMLPNGDIELRFEPNPGTLAKPGSKMPEQGFSLKMLDYEQNAVRDTAVHWIAMADVHKDAPFALDPFAAEYLSEVASMMMTFYLRRGETIAKEMGKEKIDQEVVRGIMNPLYIQTMPTSLGMSPLKWDKAQLQKKQEILKKYGQEDLFDDVSRRSGLPTKLSQLKGIPGGIQRVMGSGIGVGDVNQDGFPDLFLGGEGLGKLYINQGAKGPGRFKEQTKALGLPSEMWDVRSALFFDQDGDGDLDLLLVRSHHPSMLFRWNGKRFEDATSSTGLATTTGAHVAAVFDANQDGLLDIFVGYYGSEQVNKDATKGRNLPSIDGRNSSPAQLWVATATGKYEESATAFGVDDRGWTLAASAFDIDQDGDLDLVLANDFGANSVYENQGGGKFVPIARDLQADDRGSGMNVDITDLNLDGIFDFYVTNIDMFSKSIKIVFPKDGALIPLKADTLRSFQYITGNKLYVSEKKPQFESAEQVWFEPGDRGWAWDGNFFDYDLDGDDDLYLANGWIEGSYAHNQANQMFLQEGGKFYLGPKDSSEQFRGNSRAVAAVDIDRDGDLDLVVNNFKQAPRVFENIQTQPNQSIGLKLLGKGANMRAVGAKVEVWWGGARRHMEQVRVGRGYLSQDDPDVMVLGVGEQKEVMIKVRWPSGTETSSVWKRGESDAMLEIKE